MIQSSLKKWSFVLSYYVPVNVITSDGPSIQFIEESEDRELYFPSDILNPREYLEEQFNYDGFEICELTDFSPVKA